MSKAELGTIISKVFAIFYFFQCVKRLLTNAPLFFQTEFFGEQYVAVLYLTSFLLYLGLAVFFWFGSEKLGRLIAGKDDTKTISLFSPEQFMAGVFVAFGCLLFSYAVPHLSELIALIFRDENTRTVKLQSFDVIEKVTSIGLYSILAIIFVLGANGLQRFVFMLRNLGAEK